ncbi:MAG: hypothetical protein OEY63_08630, partial [Gemmatimonadota bacterium]|nr:hypothetical protein [Gemmatimonadota bacterium]
IQRPIDLWAGFRKPLIDCCSGSVDGSSAGVPSWTDSKATLPNNPWESFGGGTPASTDVLGESPVLDLLQDNSVTPYRIFSRPPNSRLRLNDNAVAIR